MRIATFAALLFLAAHLRADPKEIPIDGGVFEKGKCEIIIQTNPKEQNDPNWGPDVVRIVVRDSKSKKELASDLFNPFGRMTEPDPDMKAVWSPDGKYVALNLRETRHATTAYLFQVNPPKLTCIELPSYWSKAEKFLGSKADFRGGIETPLRWSDSKTLIVRSRGTLRNNDSEFGLLVTVSIKGSKPKIQSVTLNK